MINETRREHFVSLADKFVSKKLVVDAFDHQFTALWMEYRDQEVDKKKAAWPEPYDQQIIASFQRGEMSKDEFAREYRSLWGYSAEEWEFQNMTDALHLACSVFNPSPELEREISEDQLRQEAAAFLAQYQKLTLPMLHSV